MDIYTWIYIYIYIYIRKSAAPAAQRAWASMAIWTGPPPCCCLALSRAERGCAGSFCACARMRALMCSALPHGAEGKRADELKVAVKNNHAICALKADQPLAVWNLLPPASFLSFGIRPLSSR